MQLLHRLAARARGARVARLVQDGVRLRRLVEEPRRTSRLLGRALADGSFAPSAVTLRAARIGGKARLLEGVLVAARSDRAMP